MSQSQLSTIANTLAESELGDYILTRFREGANAYTIALWLQEDLLVYTNLDTKQLIAAVNEFCQAKTTVLERLELVGDGRNAIEKSVNKQKRQTSVLEELQKVYFLQLQRVNVLHTAESIVDGIKGAGANEIEILRRLLMNIHEVQQDTGSDVSMGGVSKDNATITPQLTQKLGKLLHKLIEEGDQEDVIDVEVINGES